MKKSTLSTSVQVLFLVALVIAILICGKPFLVPLTFALIISMLLLPVTIWLQKLGAPRWLGVLSAVLLFLIIIGGIVYILSWQVSGLVEDSGNMQQQATQKVTEFQKYIQEKFGVPVQQQSKLASGKSGGESGSYLSTAVSEVIAGIGGFLTDFIVFLVYVFLFLLYRSHLKEFVLRMFFSSNRSHASSVMDQCRTVAQKYVTGLALMIVCLSVMYGIGFSIVGVKSALLFAMLAAVLETVPFIGNITGTLLTMLMAVAQGGSSTMILGVFVTYLLVQFIQTYFLETLIVGAGVNINPLITIAGIIVGELIWGIPGMVLTIPLLGIAKIIFDNVEPLKPVGFLMGEVEKKSKKRK
jgi:predicted PurR-regulated permease PerM